MADDAPLVPVPPAPAVDPGMLDRGAMERVLSRATELASQSADAPDGMTEAQLFEIGKEVGLSPSALRQALAEERTRVVLAEETGLEARVLGPAVVMATRAIAHPPESILAALEEWMRSDYRMLEKRRFGNRRTWEQRSGFLADLSRGMLGNDTAAALMRANEVAVTVSPIGDGRTAVRFDADLTQQRAQRRISGIALGTAGLVVGTVPVVLGAVLAPIAMLPLFLLFGTTPLVGFGVGAWAMLKGHRKQAERTQLALEQLLDRLEHSALPRGVAGGTPPLLLDSISAVGQGLREVARAVQDAAGTRRSR